MMIFSENDLKFHFNFDYIFDRIFQCAVAARASAAQLVRGCRWRAARA